MATIQADLCTAIPNELLHQILKFVVSHSIHKICLFPTQQVREWHYHVVWTLCSVSSAFQAITKELAAKALAIKEDEGSIPKVAREKLLYLRSMGIRFQNPLGHSPASFEPANGSPLLQAYSLYVAAGALRVNVIETQEAEEVFWAGHLFMQNALGAALDLCKSVVPKGMEEPLVRAVTNQLSVIEMCTSFVRAGKDLEDSLRKLSEIENSPDRQHKTFHADSIRSTIHEAFCTIKAVEEQFASIIQTESRFTPDLKHPILQFPRVYSDMGKCSKVKFDFDEFDIKRRASAFLGGWEQIVSKSKAAQRPTS